MEHARCKYAGSRVKRVQDGLETRPQFTSLIRPKAHIRQQVGICPGERITLALRVSTRLRSWATLGVTPVSHLYSKCSPQYGWWTLMSLILRRRRRLAFSTVWLGEFDLA